MIERRLAALRTIETIRMFAASHDGKLPAALGDIKEVPVPADPLTGTNFEYQMTGDKATLTAPAPFGLEPQICKFQYELTMKR